MGPEYICTDYRDTLTVTMLAVFSPLDTLISSLMLLAGYQPNKIIWQVRFSPLAAPH